MEISKGREPTGALRWSDVRFRLGTVRLGASNLPLATDRLGLWVQPVDATPRLSS